MDTNAWLDDLNVPISEDDGRDDALLDLFDRLLTEARVIREST